MIAPPERNVIRGVFVVFTTKSCPSIVPIDWEDAVVFPPSSQTDDVLPPAVRIVKAPGPGGNVKVAPGFDPTIVE